MDAVHVLELCGLTLLAMAMGELPGRRVVYRHWLRFLRWKNPRYCLPPSRSSGPGSIHELSDYTSSVSISQGLQNLNADLRNCFYDTDHQARMNRDIAAMQMMDQLRPTTPSYFPQLQPTAPGDIQALLLMCGLNQQGLLGQPK